MRFLDYIEPATKVLPEVAKPPPGRKVPFQKRAMYTVVTLLVYLVMSQVPLYGVTTTGESDPLYLLRVILASNRGTLMELGISPIVTAGMIMQVLAGAKIIYVDQSLSHDRAVFDGAQKVLAILMTIGQAVVIILSGQYGPMSEMSPIRAILLLAQLLFAGVIVILLDELLQKGYGIGSGISLFIATNVCETIIWKSLSPTTMSRGGHTQFEGAIVAAVHLLLTRSDKLGALKEALYRDDLPNILNLMATIIVFAVVIYFQGFRVDVPLKPISGKTAQPVKPFPIKLFYTSNMPIILQTSLVSQLYGISQYLFNRFTENPFIRLLGRWKTLENGASFPVGGLAYYLSPPMSVQQVVFDPFHTFFYMAFILSTCALFSKYWIQFTGATSADVADKLKKQNLTVAGSSQRDAKKRLDRYIPTAAAFGGMCIGALSIFADALGAIGTGTGALLAVTIIYQYYEEFAAVQQAETMGIMGM